MALPRSIVENYEPFWHCEWRKQPFKAREYAVLTDYAIRDDAPEEVRGLLTAQQRCPEHRDGSGCYVYGHVTRFNLHVRPGRGRALCGSATRRS